ncbi:IS256 family transposase [Engelhardtia mirabilis]|uniref:Mutator family transposase n=1 Tax=Engelhardtia mirabilis TaxID=2528011 RepID=A0A518BHT2_9BACT|nr:Transposase, Mutator family [Planctomycetes bacterium Pla133]QDV00868.1 Transposase, Mutator family [Planctomycetes bacterium Pla86]
MKQPSDSIQFQPDAPTADILQDVLREGARKMLITALQAEVAEYIDAHADQVDEQGRRLVVRNGSCPERTIQTALGDIPIARPRVDDRRLDDGGNRIQFTSKILPPYLRRSKTIEELIPWLYLRGVSTGDFGEALGGLLGEGAAGLSASTVVRLKQAWEEEHRTWSKRELAGKHYVYLWADGIHSNVRLTDERACMLVIMGATADGKKELVAVHDGERESEQSWTEVLVDLKARGLSIAPKLVVADGALGFWKASAKVWPTAQGQRCWVHKTANVLNKCPKSMHPKIKASLTEIWNAETREDAEAAMILFQSIYGAKYPKAVECLLKDREAMLAFYDFPAEHWRHLRTTNPIESTFATIRLRTSRTKGAGSRAACLAMVYKLAKSAEKTWRKLNGHEHLGDVIRGVQFKDGIKVAA